MTAINVSYSGGDIKINDKSIDTSGWKTYNFDKTPATFETNQRIIRILDMIKDGSITCGGENLYNPCNIDCKIDKDNITNLFDVNGKFIKTEPYKLEDWQQSINASAKHDYSVRPMSWLKVSFRSPLSEPLEYNYIFNETGIDADYICHDPKKTDIDKTNTFVFNMATEIIDPAFRKQFEEGDYRFPEIGTKITFDNSFMKFFGLNECQSLTSTCKKESGDKNGEYEYNIAFDRVNINQSSHVIINNHTISQNGRTVVKPVSWYAGNKQKGILFNMFNMIGMNMSDSKMCKQAKTDIKSLYSQKIQPPVEKVIYGWNSLKRALCLSKELGDFMQIAFMFVFVHYRLKQDETYTMITSDNVVYTMCCMLNLACIYCKGEDCNETPFSEQQTVGNYNAPSKKETPTCFNIEVFHPSRKYYLGNSEGDNDLLLYKKQLHLIYQHNTNYINAMKHLYSLMDRETKSTDGGNPKRKRPKLTEQEYIIEHIISHEYTNEGITVYIKWEGYEEITAENIAKNTTIQDNKVFKAYCSSNFIKFPELKKYADNLVCFFVNSHIDQLKYNRDTFNLYIEDLEQINKLFYAVLNTPEITMAGVPKQTPEEIRAYKKKMSTNRHELGEMYTLTHLIGEIQSETAPIKGINKDEPIKYQMTLDDAYTLELPNGFKSKAFGNDYGTDSICKLFEKYVNTDYDIEDEPEEPAKKRMAYDMSPMSRINSQSSEHHGGMDSKQTDVSYLDYLKHDDSPVIFTHDDETPVDMHAEFLEHLKQCMTDELGITFRASADSMSQKERHEIEVETWFIINKYRSHLYLVFHIEGRVFYGKELKALLRKYHDENVAPKHIKQPEKVHIKTVHTTRKNSNENKPNVLSHQTRKNSNLASEPNQHVVANRSKSRKHTDKNFTTTMKKIRQNPVLAKIMAPLRERHSFLNPMIAAGKNPQNHTKKRRYR